MAGKKRVLLTLLEENDGLAKLLGSELSKSGLDVAAHFLDTNQDAMAIANVSRELATYQAWVVAGNDFANPLLRKTLAIIALNIQNDAGSNFPIIISPSASTKDLESLPTPLKSAEIVKNGLGAKVAVRAATFKPNLAEYRLKAHDLGRLGLWFEVGPREGFWKGAFFASGIAQDEKGVPTSHGVGIAGTIPEKCTLNYPVEGMKLSVHDIPCVGFGVHNEFNANTSYYVRVSAYPDEILFGAFPDDDETDLYSLTLLGS
ncbi:MAG: hypothetical protein IJT59_04895 [Desulfovibrionaceae bacterium]|nr:hypothetical protein [Desulfovibrionaceae bacterium]